MSYSQKFRILRKKELNDDPCAALQKLAVQNYGPSLALPVSLLRSWYEKNNSIFRIAVTSENSVAGYISALPLFAGIFEQTIESDFDENLIAAEDIDPSFCTSDGGVFISSIVVSPDYQSKYPVSLLLRLALIEDLISECSIKNQRIRISAQTLSSKGEACIQSLGLEACGVTHSGWRIYYGKLGSTDLHFVHAKLQQKIASRFGQTVACNAS